MPPSPGGCGQRVRDGDADGAVEQFVEVLAPADGDGGDRDAVLQDQTPAADPGDQLAEGGVRVRVRGAGDRDGAGQLGVGERGEERREAGDHEGEGDRGSGLGDGLAEDHEDAGAEGGTDADHGQLPHARGSGAAMPPSPWPPSATSRSTGLRRISRAPTPGVRCGGLCAGLRGCALIEHCGGSFIAAGQMTAGDAAAPSGKGIPEHAVEEPPSRGPRHATYSA